jgi:hypothetical protein
VFPPLPAEGFLEKKVNEKSKSFLFLRSGCPIRQNKPIKRFCKNVKYF